MFSYRWVLCNTQVQALLSQLSFRGPITSGGEHTDAKWSGGRGIGSSCKDGDTHSSLESQLDPALVGDEPQWRGDRVLIATVCRICLNPKRLPSYFLEC